MPPRQWCCFYEQKYNCKNTLLLVASAMPMLTHHPHPATRYPPRATLSFFFFLLMVVVVAVVGLSAAVSCMYIRAEESCQS